MCKFKQFIAQDCGHVAGLELEEKCQMAERVSTWDHCPRHNPQNQFTEVEVPGSCDDCGGGDDTKEKPDQDWSQASQAELHSDSDPDRDLYEDPPHREPVPQTGPTSEPTGDEEYQRILRETADEARRNQASHEDEFEAQIRKAMAASAQEYGASAGGNTEEELERVLAASKEEHQAQTENDFEAQLAQVLAASKAEASKNYFQSPEEEEEAVRRLLEESAAEHQHNAAADEEEQLRRIMEESARAFDEDREAQEEAEMRRIMKESRLSWQQSSWGNPTGLNNAYVDPSIDQDPYGKGKGPRDPDWKPRGDLSDAMSGLSLSKDDHPRRWAEEEDDAASQHSNGKLPSRSTQLCSPTLFGGHSPVHACVNRMSREKEERNSALAEFRAIRAQQDAAYTASAAADRKKARLQQEAEEKIRAHLDAEARVHKMLEAARLYDTSASNTPAIQAPSPQRIVDNLSLAQDAVRDRAKAKLSSAGADEGLQTPGAPTKQNDSTDDESDKEADNPRTPSALRRARLAALDRLQSQGTDNENSDWNFDNI